MSVGRLRDVTVLALLACTGSGLGCSRRPADARSTDVSQATVLAIAEALVVEFGEEDSDGSARLLLRAAPPWQSTSILARWVWDEEFSQPKYAITEQLFGTGFDRRVWAPWTGPGDTFASEDGSFVLHVLADEDAALSTTEPTIGWPNVMDDWAVVYVAYAADMQAWVLLHQVTRGQWKVSSRISWQTISCTFTD